MRAHVGSESCHRQRRRALGLTSALAIGLVIGLAGGCNRGGHWHATDVTGVYPPLAFTMTRAASDKPVTAADFRGRVVMLYFGYTKCQTICPATLGNLVSVFQRLGPLAD